MRQFRFPNALPSPDVPAIDLETGLWTPEWLAAMQADRIQQGGQGGDALYDVDINSQTLGEENRNLIQALERRQANVDIALATALTVLGDLARVDIARTRNIAANAVSDVAAANTASSDITNTNPKRSNSNTVTETADLTFFENAATVIVLIDFEHTIDLGAYDWCVMRLDLTRTPRSGGSATTLRSWRWVQAGSSANSQFPVALETNNQTVTVPFTAVYADTLPASGGGGFDASGYTYSANFYVTDDWDDGSTMIDGYDTPSSDTKHHRIEDLNLVLTHLRR